MSSEMPHAPQVLIVGAGVIGMLTALELHRRGRRVTVVDRGVAGGESSWAGGGILSPILPWNYPAPVWQLSRRSLDLYPLLADELRTETGVDPERTESGALMLDPSGFDVARRWCADQGLAYGDVQEAVHPGAPMRPALLLPWVGQIRNPRLGQALAIRLGQLGIGLLEHRAAEGWLRDGTGRVIGLRTAQGDLHAEQLVLAAGAWSGGLGGLPVVPVRGQMLLLKTDGGAMRRIVLDQGRYLIPRRDGHVLVGSTVEAVGFDKRITSPARDLLVAFASGLVGFDVTSRVVAHWSGLRPGCADGIPFIGPHPALPGVWVNTGHYRNGLVMAPASAELLADLMQTCPTRVDASVYGLSEDRRELTGTTG